MNTDEMRAAIREANRTLIVADDIARMLEGRLRKVSPYVLAKLKSELSNFNAHTKTWKN